MRAARPFWLPTSNYYVLATAVSIAFFFLTWGLLHDLGDQTPWITAGVGACMLLCIAVLLREVILRRTRYGRTNMTARVAMRPKPLSVRIEENPGSDKLTLEKNALLLSEIKKKSDAANLLDKFSAAHREVFEICAKYLERNDKELHTITVDSPRFGALLKGRTTASEFHKFHVLRWAELEAKTLTVEAQTRTRSFERIEAAQNALGVIESALQFYPVEQSLIESHKLVLDLVASIKVSTWVEKAERAAFKGNFKQAKSFYRDALFYLGRDNIQSESRRQAAEKITAEIERIELTESERAE